jgi:hypothetical protein
MGEVSKTLLNVFKLRRRIFSLEGLIMVENQSEKPRSVIVKEIVAQNKEWYGSKLPQIKEKLAKFNSTVLWASWDEVGADVPPSPENKSYQEVKHLLIPIVPNFLLNKDFEALRFMRKHQYEIAPMKNLGFVVEPVKSHLPIFVGDQYVGEFIARLKFLDDWYILSELAYAPLRAILEIEEAGVQLSLWNTIEKALDIFLTMIANTQGKEVAQRILYDPRAMDYYRMAFFVALGVFRELDIITFDLLDTLKEV